MANEVVAKVYSGVNPKQTPEELLEHYNQWANTYDKELTYVDYQAPSIAADFLVKHMTLLNLPKGSQILDVCAGTGDVAQILSRKFGYNNIDAIDGSQDMLKIAEKLGIYTKIMTAWIGGGHQMPVEDNAYDAIVIAGAVAPAHLPLDSFLECIRVVKSGGVIVNVMRSLHVQSGHEYEVLKSLTRGWEAEGKWKCIEETIPEDRRFMKGYDALVTVHYVL